MEKDVGATWRGVTVEQAVNRCAEALIDRGLATKQRGYSANVLSAVNRRLGRPMPPDLHAFYANVTPVGHFPEPEYGLVCFQPADDLNIKWLDDPTLRDGHLNVGAEEECWLEGWAQSRPLVFGYTPFGDSLLWSEGLKDYPAGTIILTDHESDENPVVLGDSFGEWLARYHAFGLSEFAIAPGSLDEIAKPKALAFVADHLRLNPQSQWAKHKLEILEKR